MPFAGHPTLGSAHVARRLVEATNGRSPQSLTLEMKAGLIQVVAHRDLWTLSANEPAVGFYRRLGGRTVVETGERVGDAVLPVVVFGWDAD